jgi:hypothetical protein
MRPLISFKRQRGSIKVLIIKNTKYFISLDYTLDDLVSKKMYSVVQNTIKGMSKLLNSAIATGVTN